VSRLFLLDENLTPIGRALHPIYPQVIVSEDTEGLGRGADDELHIIPWLKDHDAVWVTKDWHRYRNRAQAKWIYEQGVCVAWFRPFSHREPRLEDLLITFAKAMPKLIRLFDRTGMVYATIDQSGALTELSLARLLRGNL